jgi:hypothetical protein
VWVGRNEYLIMTVQHRHAQCSKELRGLLNGSLRQGIVADWQAGMGRDVGGMGMLIWGCAVGVMCFLGVGRPRGGNE